MSETKKNEIYAPFKPDEESPFIFVSYAHADRDRVFPIITQLYEKGWRVWYDEGLPAGKNYYASLGKHIKECAVFLLFVTENSVKSTFVCENELLLAASERKRMAICRLDKNAEFTGEAKDAIDIATASKKNPKTDEAGLESALEGIEELKRVKPRKAEGYNITQNEGIALIEKGDEYGFENSDGGVRLTGYRGKEENVILPAFYKKNNLPVVELDTTFWGNENVKTVQIPATVKKIGETFSGCKNLTDVYIPASVKEIEEDAFSDVKNCTIHCAENSSAHKFAEAHKMPVTFDYDPGSVDIPESDGDYVFCSYADDKKDEAKRIIEKLRENKCRVVDSETVPSKGKNKSYRNAKCVLGFLSKGYIDDDEIDYIRRAIDNRKEYILYELEKCALPSDLEMTIGADQRLSADKSEKDNIAKLVNWISENGCVETSADIPGFEYTTNIRGEITLLKYTGTDSDVTIPAEHAGYPIVDFFGTFVGCENLKSVTIPESVRLIGFSAFRGCSSLTSITILEGVEEIGFGAFLDCSSLTSITIPNSVKEIDFEAFEGCSSLTSITIPESVKEIGFDAFSNCRSLTSITIPNSVTKIGANAFKGCDNLTVYCPENSYAWKYCEENNIPHKPLKKRKSCLRKLLAPIIVLLAVIAAAVGVQFSGLFDILDWLKSVLPFFNS